MRIRVVPALMLLLASAPLTAQVPPVDREKSTVDTVAALLTSLQRA